MGMNSVKPVRALKVNKSNTFEEAFAKIREKIIKAMMTLMASKISVFPGKPHRCIGFCLKFAIIVVE